MKPFSKFNFIVSLVFGMIISSSANAGHLFTQASSNTPILLNAGQGINVTQLTYEGQSTPGNVLLYFGGDWSAGDAIRVTINNWTQTFQFDNPLSGTTQSSSALAVNDPTLAAAHISVSGQTTWTVVATSGTFTWTGYRIYVDNATYNGTGADTITQSQVVSVGYESIANPNERSVGATLDGLSGATGQMGDVLTVLDAMTDDSKRTAMQLISPNRSQVMEQSSINTTTAALDTVEIRLDALRAGMDFGSNVGHSGVSSGDGKLNHAFWFKGFGGKANQDSQNGFAGSNSNVYGMMAGLDRTTESDWLLGGAFSYARTNVDMGGFRDGDETGINTYQFTGYLGKNFAQWYLQSMLTYAYQDYETSRDTHLTGIARGDFNGDVFGGRVVAGKPLNINADTTLTPSIGFEALHINQDGYTETGAGVLSLNVNDSDANRARAIIGVELAKLKKLSDNGLLRPSLKATWRHEFIDDGVNATSTFLGGGSPFESIGQTVNDDVFGLSARLNWEKTEQISMAIELGTEHGDGYFGLNGQVTGRYRF